MTGLLNPKSSEKIIIIIIGNFFLHDSRCVPEPWGLSSAGGNSFHFPPKISSLGEVLTPLQLETRFWGQHYLDLV